MSKAAKKSKATAKAKIEDPNYPKRPANVYTLFVKDFFKNNSGSFNEITTASSVAWRSMSDVEKEPYRKRADAAKAQYDREIAAYTPLKGFGTNGKKISKGANGLARKNNKKSRDNNAPKRSIGAYLHFQNKNRSKFSKEIENSTNQLSLATYTSKIWNEMSDYEKLPYKQMAEKDSERYTRELKTYASQQEEGSFYNSKGLTSNNTITFKGSRIVLSNAEEADPNFPKGPRRSFILFTSYVRANPPKGWRSLTFLQQAEKIGKMWGELDTNETLG
eukprot:CAMPEP_0182515330 /NCGR_PEP_ID=MMETSP1321-20130603/37839_1 /TAXON_ID=91990 /ORGANISM="Bolidomonas sp., Strain RCC1657" /LENGTH=275 /DNA_ID=CAMNT_0024722725 /DNA_START=104 /DNA_END=927 /DNA_ORIENTATION=-